MFQLRTVYESPNSLRGLFGTTDTRNAVIFVYVNYFKVSQNYLIYFIELKAHGSGLNYLK